MNDDRFYDWNDQLHLIFELELICQDSSVKWRDFIKSKNLGIEVASDVFDAPIYKIVNETLWKESKIKYNIL